VIKPQPCDTKFILVTVFSFFAFLAGFCIVMGVNSLSHEMPVGAIEAFLFLVCALISAIWARNYFAGLKKKTK